jgi:hypothetical protein
MRMLLLLRSVLNLRLFGLSPKRLLVLALGSLVLLALASCSGQFPTGLPVKLTVELGGQGVSVTIPPIKVPQ